jgi:hypothetical protein
MSACSDEGLTLSFTLTCLQRGLPPDYVQSSLFARRSPETVHFSEQTACTLDYSPLLLSTGSPLDVD